MKKQRITDQMPMNMSEKLDLEKRIRESFNKIFNASTEKKKLSPSKSATNHEFDIYEEGNFIGGINTSKRLTPSGNNNTGGQDRVSSEILWLTLWEGNEKRVMILTNPEMHRFIKEKYKSWKFPKKILMLCFDEESLQEKEDAYYLE